MSRLSQPGSTASPPGWDSRDTFRYKSINSAHFRVLLAMESASF